MSKPAQERTTRVWTIPNILCFVRLVGSPFLIWLAIADLRYVFVGLFVFLMATDWLDGKLARMLNQRSVLGAKVDTWADATMYAGLLFGVVWLSSEIIADDLVYVGIILVVYAVAIGFSLLKFSAWPSYHTRSAKTGWLFALVGGSLLILEGYVWPFRVAMLVVLIGLIESIAITATLSRKCVDVPSIFAARKIEKGEA